MMGKFILLGTGASAGVPVIGCQCVVCTSSSPYNQRLRQLGLLYLNDKTILIDVGPDFRQQALRHKIHRLDGLMLTHTHFDHIAGIDELRVFYFRQKQALPSLLSQESYEDLQKRYYYLFRPIGEAPTLSAQLELHLLPESEGNIEFLGLAVCYFSYFQGDMKVTGYRIGEFAYVSDIREYEETIFHALKGVKQLVVGALREKPSRAHFSLDEAVDFARKVEAKMTYITHTNHEVDYEAANATLPSDVRLSFDGLEIEFGI